MFFMSMGLLAIIATNPENLIGTLNAPAFLVCMLEKYAISKYCDFFCVSALWEMLCPVVLSSHDI